jgi:RNA polymerase sigma factor (sigma-70 family)
MTKISKRELNRFTEAYMLYYPQILSSILLKVGSVEDARDICQEVFIILYEKFDTVNNVRAWLYGTLKNVVYKYYSSKKQDVDIDKLFDSIKLSYSNGFRDARIIINQVMDEVQCSQAERIILDLIAVHNFSYVNVATILGLTKRQVEYKYGQLVKCITDNLKKKGIKDIEELL